MKSNFDKQCLNLIVPITCGAKKGTAFFVSSNQLLTARHVVSPALYDGVTNIFAKINGQYVVCTAKQLGEDEEPIDIALLTCHNYTMTDLPFKLLYSHLSEDMELCMSGYPEELGNSIERFDLDVSYRKTINRQEFDMVILRKDPLAFCQYNGFSGSPILNYFGSVVGIAVVQSNNVLGAFSINSLTESLTLNGISFSAQWENEDMSLKGLGRCQQLIKKSLMHAGNRYSKDLHHPDPELDAYIERFMHYESYITWNEKTTEIKEWAKNRRSTVATKFSDEYEYNEYDELTYYLENCNKEQALERDNIALEEKRQAKKHLEDIKSLYKHYELSQHKILLLTGKAGGGKTHYVCHIANKLCINHHTYLTFGSQYSATTEALDQLLNLNGFTQEDLQMLNDHMIESRRFALFIIDALNEGASELYWETQIDYLIRQFAKYSNLKLIVTIRDPFDYIIFKNISPCSYLECPINGFYNPKEAALKYFAHYGIPQEVYDEQVIAFNNPLFLRIFCLIYSQLNYYQLRDIDRLTLFDNYLTFRNETVSILVDEDPRRNITSIFLNKLASYSAFYADCNKISRNKARSIADHCCIHRTWSKNLLNATLRENLLMDAYEQKNGKLEDMILFEYENIGDFLKARAIHDSKMSDEACIDFLISIYKKLHRKENLNFSKFHSMVTALISIWKRPLNLIEKKEFADGPFRINLINSLIYKGNHHAKIIAWMTEKIDRINPIILLNSYHSISVDSMEKIHILLKTTPLAKRDEHIAIEVNRLYEKGDKIGEQILRLQTYNKNVALNLAIVLCWMESSSHPYLRAYITRQLYRILTEHPHLILALINLFKDVDDPYVQQGLYAAMYGYTLICTDNEYVDLIAETIFNAHYAGLNNVPLDLIVRTWTLKILERAHALNPNSSFWTQSQPPYSNTPDPLNWKDAEVEKNYFGESDGSLRIYGSLFGEQDFSHYIIGTNDDFESRIFFDESSNPILLNDITLMIASVIKNQLGWNEGLAKYDYHRSSTNRHTNKTERIGKKFQWIAYYRIMALLSDHYYAKDFNIPPFPWHIDKRNRFDPTLEDNNTLVTSLKLHFKPYPETNIGNETPEEWINNDTLLPQLNLIITDSDNTEWIMLISYDSKELEIGKYESQRFSITTETCFVHSVDTDKIISWEKSQNLFKPWIPNRYNYAYEFRWNEYPWAENYRFMDNERKTWQRVNKNPCEIMFTTESQLQEDNTGLLNNEYQANAYMPCVEMMSELKLYTAERGIIRRKDDHSIAAINRSPYIDTNDGLFIRRDLLNQFLQMKGYSMFYYVQGGKIYQSTSFDKRDLSACYRYQLEGSIETLQPLQVIPNMPYSEMNDHLRDLLAEKLAKNKINEKAMVKNSDSNNSSTDS